MERTDGPVRDIRDLSQLYGGERSGETGEVESRGEERKVESKGEERKVERKERSEARQGKGWRERENERVGQGCV